MNRITKRDRRVELGDSALSRATYRVLFPVVEHLAEVDWLTTTVGRGTCALILGESREEYVAREMTRVRRDTETSRHLREFTASLAALTTDPVLAAVDHEPWGIKRLHGLVPDHGGNFAMRPPEAVAFKAEEVGRAAKQLGVGMFLSPVLDVLTGPNPWLQGRTLNPASHAVVAELARAVVAGTQAGGVATVAKHFPGFPYLEHDPALVAHAAVPSGRWDADSLGPFRAAVEAGTTAVMLGPAIVEDVDETEPASTSSAVVDCLQRHLGFGGVIVSDDLDAAATLRGRTLTETALASLRAGVHLLLVGGGEHLHDVANAVLVEALRDVDLARHVLESAHRITLLTERYGMTS